MESIQALKRGARPNLGSSMKPQKPKTSNSKLIAHCNIESPIIDTKLESQLKTLNKNYQLAKKTLSGRCSYPNKIQKNCKLSYKPKPSRNFKLKASGSINEGSRTHKHIAIKTIRMSSPNATNTSLLKKTCSNQNVLVNKHIEDDNVEPEDEREININRYNLSTRGDTEILEVEVDGDDFKRIDDIKLSYLSLSLKNKHKSEAKRFEKKPQLQKNRLTPQVSVEKNKKKAKPRLSSPQVCTTNFNSTQLVPKILLELEKETTSPLDLTQDINELETSNFDSNASCSYKPRTSIRKLPSHSNASFSSERRPESLSRPGSVLNQKLKPAKSNFSKEKSADLYDMFDWCSDFDEYVHPHSYRSVTKLDDQLQLLDECFDIFDRYEPDCNTKFILLKEFMDAKADRIQREQEIVLDQKNKYVRSSKPQARIEESDSEDFEHLRQRATTEMNRNIPRVRVSVRTKKPMSSNPVLNAGVQSIIEYSHDKYEQLIGYIDSLGCFCINHSSDYCHLNTDWEGPITRKTSSERDEEARKINDLSLAFKLITEILYFEINKTAKQSKHKTNIVMKILRWHYDFETSFNEYYEKTSESMYEPPDTPKLTIKSILNSILN